MQISDLLAAIEGGEWPFRPAFGAGYEADIQGMSVQHYQLANSAYCGSLDAAKALHEAVLPEYGWDTDSGCSASVWVVGRVPGRSRRYSVKQEYSATDNHNPARAWLICILKALIAAEDN